MYTKELTKIINHYGHLNQKIVATEEFGELIQAISKDQRGEGDRDNLIEEIADCEIMLTQLRIMYGLGESVEVIKKLKIERQLKRIENEKYS